MKGKRGIERDPARLCTATKRDGSPCPNYKIQGGNVCMAHGGKAPQVKAKAQRTLQETRQQIHDELIPDAIKQLKRIINDKASTNSDITNAAKLLMQASGVSVHNNITAVQVNNHIDNGPSPFELIQERLGMMAAQHLSSPLFESMPCPTCGRTSTPASDDSSARDGDVVDAEVVEFPVE